jgi:glycosyltransferase involved in cell wall biosynthesis
MPLDDFRMAKNYSACDVTLGIGLGEGFGYPIFESLACGTPCIHGNYAGAAEHMRPEMRVNPVTYRTEGPFGWQRPVHSAADWAQQVEDVVRLMPQGSYAGGRGSLLPPYLEWDNLWPRWEKWLAAGVQSAAGMEKEELVPQRETVASAY